MRKGEVVIDVHVQAAVDSDSARPSAEQLEAADARSRALASDRRSALEPAVIGLSGKGERACCIAARLLGSAELDGERDSELGELKHVVELQEQEGSVSESQQQEARRRGRTENSSLMSSLSLPEWMFLFESSNELSMVKLDW